MNTNCKTTIVLFAILAMTTTSYAQPRTGKGGGPPFGRGMGKGAGGPGHQHDDRHDTDHEVFRFLLTNHQKITRVVKELPIGVETLTESEDAEIAAKIKEHVKWMEYRIEKTNPIRMRDPLFAEIFKHTDKIKMKREETAKGVRVIETSEDPYVVELIKAHAKAVSGFVERGFAAAMKNHAVPGRGEAKVLEYTNPVIKTYGKVVQLPAAKQQPRESSRIVVDLTRGGESDSLYPAIEKVARFVNIYAGAGAEAKEAKIAVVIHGDATLAVLNDDAYSEKFRTQGNPNFDCLHKLHESGVEIYVCGQSLIAKGEKSEDVVVFVDTAVSALTAIVNLQMDGYAYVPLSK